MRGLWEGLDPRRRIIALLSAATIVAAVFGISRVASSTDMALLYSGLDPAAAGEVVAALEAQGVPFEVRDSAIYVDSARRDQMRIALAAEGLPQSGPAGYELLDSLSGFGTTSQMFDAAYWRAKEGELARTITASTNVRSARVHIATPVHEPFTRPQTGSASVTVTMGRGTLDAEQAQAIRYLVASSVAGIPPEAVAVIDSARGVVLATGDAADANRPAIDPDVREETLRKNVERLLEARVGAGRAIVQVSVDADMDSQTITERVIDPQSRVAISSEVEESNESQSGTSPGVTVASNLPDGDVGGEASNSSRNATQSRERMNFEVSETRRERVIVPGQVRRISVAVMVDGVTAPGPDGTLVWTPRSEEELTTLRELVQTAIGFDAARGDTVTLETLQFSAAPEQGTLAERAGDSFLTLHGSQIAQMAVLGLIVLALILFVLRPMLARPQPTPLDALMRPGEGANPGPARLGGPAVAGMGDVLELPPVTATKIDRLREVITSRSDESATVLRNWIEAPDHRRETAGS